MIVLDIETAPQPQYREHIAALRVAEYRDDLRPVPASYSGARAALWRDNDRAKWAATCAEGADAVAKAMALNPRTGMIVAVGLFSGPCGDVEEPTVVHTANMPESDVVATALDAIKHHSPLITYNGMAFDVPYLAIRAAMLGLTLPFSLAPLLRRYENRHHLDLCAILSSWQRPREGDTLHGWARAFGLRVEDDTTGADVGRMLDAGDFAGIAEHCKSDIILTHQLAERIRAAGLC